MKNFKPILASLLLITGVFTIGSESLGDRNAIAYARRVIQGPFIPKEHKLYLLAQAIVDAQSDTSKDVIRSMTSTFATVPPSLFTALNKRIDHEKQYNTNKLLDASLIRKCNRIITNPDYSDSNKIAYLLEAEKLAILETTRAKIDNVMLKALPTLPAALMDTTDDIELVATITPSPFRAVSASPTPRPSPTVFETPDRVTASPSRMVGIAFFDPINQAFGGAGRPKSIFDKLME